MNLVQEQEFYLKLGSKIREARLLAGISQEILGDQLSLTRSSIVNIEKGRQRPLAHTIFEISQVLRIPIINLLPNISEQESTGIKLVASSVDNIDIISDQKEINKETEDAVKKFVSFLKKDQ